MARGPTGLIKPVESYIRRQRTNRTYSQFTFPEDLGPHSIVFNFSEYSYNRSTNAVNPTTNRILNTSIQLPLPQNLTDSYNINISGIELDQLGAAIAQSTTAFNDWNNMSAKDTLQAALDTVGNLGDAAVNVQLRRMLSAIDPNSAQGVSIGSGKTVNPHLALTFDGVSLKEHNFTWNLAPSTAKESETLKKIIQKIKYHSHPEYQNLQGELGGATGDFTSRTFLKFPDVVDIFFLGTQPGYIYYFKRAMIRNFSVDYSGAGQPAFLEGGKPAMFNISMGVTEQEIHTRQDYEDDLYE